MNSDDYRDDHKYDDIINLPHPTSKNHMRMRLEDRAAQFAPFAALTGHEAAIKETARLTDKKHTLSDEAIAALNEKLNIIAGDIDARLAAESDASLGTEYGNSASLGTECGAGFDTERAAAGGARQVSITYFVPDERKSGGAYVTHCGIAKRIDLHEHVLIMADGTVIPIGQISAIEGELFDDLNI